MTSYPVKCALCGESFDSFDSYGDSRAMRDDHMLRRHPDEPDPHPDARWSIGGAS